MIYGSNNVTPVFIYNFQIWPLIISIAGTRLDAPYIYQSIKVNPFLGIKSPTNPIEKIPIYLTKYLPYKLI